MADFDLIVADQVNVVERIESMTLVANVAIVAGQTVDIDDSTGQWVLGGASAFYGIATKSVAAGIPLTAIHQGTMDGWVLDGLDWGDTVYLAASGALAASGSVVAGRVVPGLSQPLGSDPDKILKVGA